MCTTLESVERSLSFAQATSVWTLSYLRPFINGSMGITWKIVDLRPHQIHSCRPLKCLKPSLACFRISAQLQNVNWIIPFELVSMPGLRYNMMLKTSPGICCRKGRHKDKDKRVRNLYVVYKVSRTRGPPTPKPMILIQCCRVFCKEPVSL